MPTYEYACNACGGHFEYFQWVSEAPMTKCEKCGGELTRLLSGGTGLIFRGSGFYITDYKGGSGEKSSGGGASKSEPKSDAKSAESGGGTKSESPAPAAKKESKAPKSDT